MDLHAQPFDFEVEFLLQLFDDALADIAEGSDIIGKNFDMDGHKRVLVFTKTEALAQLEHITITPNTKLRTPGYL